MLHCAHDVAKVSDQFFTMRQVVQEGFRMRAIWDFMRGASG